MPPILDPNLARNEKRHHAYAMYEADRASQSLGMTITHLTDGEVRGHFTVTSDMCNGHGIAHGGYLFTFADSLFAGACNGPSAAVGFHAGIHYITPAREGDRVDGVAIQRSSWGRNGITDVTLTANGQLIAEFRGTSRTIKNPESAPRTKPPGKTG